MSLEKIKRLTAENAALMDLVDETIAENKALEAQLATLRRLWSEMPVVIHSSLRQYEPDLLNEWVRALGELIK